MQGLWGCMSDMQSVVSMYVTWDAWCCFQGGILNHVLFGKRKFGGGSAVVGEKRMPSASASAFGEDEESGL